MSDLGTSSGGSAGSASAGSVSAASLSSRQRRRSMAILTGLGAFLLVSFLVAFSYIQGWIPAGGSADQPTAAGPAPTTSCTSPAPLPAPSTITVNVYNATERSGLAATTAKALADQGFVVAAVSNDPVGKPVQVVAQIRFGTSGAAKAEVVALRFPGAVKVADDKRTDDVVDVAIGEKFAAVAPPPTVAPTPTC